MKTPYLLVMRGDIEPELHGPYETQTARDKAAIAHRREHGLDDGVFALDINREPLDLDIWSYGAGFMDEGEESDMCLNEVPERTPVAIVCERCGSADVRRDADAVWNKVTQEWELCAVYDGATCEVCEGQTRLVEVDEKPSGVRSPSAQ